LLSPIGWTQSKLVLAQAKVQFKSSQVIWFQITNANALRLISWARKGFNGVLHNCEHWQYLKIVVSLWHKRCYNLKHGTICWLTLWLTGRCASSDTGLWLTSWTPLGGVWWAELELR